MDDEGFDKIDEALEEVLDNYDERKMTFEK